MYLCNTFGHQESSIIHYIHSCFLSVTFNSCVMIQCKMLSCICKRSWKISTRLCLCLSASSTIFAHTFLMSRFLVKIFLIVPISVHFLCYIKRNFTHCKLFFLSIIPINNFLYYLRNITSSFAKFNETFNLFIALIQGLTFSWWCTKIRYRQ